MTSALDTTGDDTTGFRVHAIAIPAYRVDVSAPFPLVDADTEAHSIAALLAPFGGIEDGWDTPADERDATWVKQRLDDWASRGLPGSSVLVWLGHGESDGDQAWLASYRTEQGKKGTGHSPSELAQFIIDEWVTRKTDDGAWSLVVVEACKSQHFVDLLAAEVSGTSRAPLRIAFACSGGESTTDLGRFRGALLEVLTKGFTDNDDTIGIRDLFGRLDDRLDKVGGGMITRHLGGARPITRPRDFTTGITAPQDVYLELKTFVATLSDDVRGHFLPKAQGAEQGDLAWYFVGRDDERRHVTTWLRHTAAGLLVVTGPAGSGKSALLGNLLVHTTPDLRDLLIHAGQITRLPGDEQPPDDVFDTVLTLTGMTTLDIVTRLTDAAGLDPQPPDATPAQRVEGLLDGLRQRSKPFTVLLDALDEAQDPLAIAGTLVRRVAAVPGCRVVVGTRRSTHEGPDLPDPVDTNILDALGGHNLATVTVGIDPQATTEYVRLRLTAARTTVPAMAEVTGSAVDRVAGLIGERQRPFLYARLAVHEILAHPALLTTDTDALDELLAKDHRALFAHALHRLDQHDPAYVPLLEALAYAQGRGLPRADRIWTTVANALTDTVQITDTDIDHVLTAAAPYIMLDHEAGQSVYRLAHRTYQEHFLTPDATP